MKVYIYKIFERFWHWTQVTLIVLLAVTGFEIHGYYELFGYREAVMFHDRTAWAFLVLIVFAIFWHFTTGEWKQYVPTMKLVKEQISYYITGIFTGAEHPTNKLVYNKFNPLQRIIYLGLKILVIPVMVISGFAYMYLNYPNVAVELSGLGLVAAIHTMGAFFLIVFIIAHVYLTTTGHKPLSSIKAMITGWEEMDEKEAREMVISEMEYSLKKTKEHFLSEKDSSAFLDKALEETEEKLGVKKVTKFRDVIANSGAGYFKIDSTGHYIEVNKAWVGLYKYGSIEEIIGKHYSLSRSGNALKQLDETFNKVLSGETVEHGLVIRKCKDGSVGYHTITMTPWIEDEKIKGVQGFILDVDSTNAAKMEWDNN
ncbi:MAG: cytochrome b/b6 domain-containing protein [Bacteroidales bacterium]|nr:cytochrome b/b6 domain-containing protein [Bacteroidales bacterium]